MRSKPFILLRSFGMLNLRKCKNQKKNDKFYTCFSHVFPRSVNLSLFYLHQFAMSNRTWAVKNGRKAVEVVMNCRLLIVFLIMTFIPLDGFYNVRIFFLASIQTCYLFLRFPPTVILEWEYHIQNNQVNGLNTFYNWLCVRKCYHEFTSGLSIGGKSADRIIFYRLMFCL